MCKNRIIPKIQGGYFMMIHSYPWPLVADESMLLGASESIVDELLLTVIIHMVMS